METERRDGWDTDEDHCQAQSKLDRIRMGYDDYFASDDSRAAIDTDSPYRDRPTARLPQPPTSSPVHVSESDQPIWELIPSSGAHLSVGVSLLCHPFISHPVGHYRVSGWLAGIRTFAMGVQWIAVVLVAINREPSPPALPPTRHMCRG